MSERNLPLWPWTASVVLGLFGMSVFGWCLFRAAWVAGTTLSVPEAARRQMYYDASSAALICCLLAVCIGIFRLTRQERKHCKRCRISPP